MGALAKRAAVNRAQLEHVIRASAAISGDDEIVVIGSQSILGQFPARPPELCVSNEADVYPKNKPELADVIDGAIGELSAFHDTFGWTRRVMTGHDRARSPPSARAVIAT